MDRIESHDVVSNANDELKQPSTGSFDTGDPNTTNIYLGHINPMVSFLFFISQKNFFFNCLPNSNQI